MQATASGYAAIDAYEMDLNRPGYTSRQLVLNARELEYPEASGVRLLLTVLDVTESRLSDKVRDDQLHEKTMMLQKLQHRVANSLQIIASVLMQSARRVQSEETRGHLHDAHHRVLSIAAVQRQLARSTLSDVVLSSYLTDLCRSIGASMIGDRNQVTLEVVTDESMIGADASVTLGLIVTELVINALKHAFPNGRSGSIKVGYRANGTDWTLTVSDDGVGIDGGIAGVTPRLGTSIVQALAAQLNAVVVVAPADPGTVVSIKHTARAEPVSVGGLTIRSD